MNDFIMEIIKEMNKDLYLIFRIKIKYRPRGEIAV